MADPSFLYLPAPHEGMDLSVAPHQLPATKASRLKNFLVHEESRLPIRGPARTQQVTGVISNSTSTGTLTNPLLAFPMPIEDKFIVNPIDLTMVGPRWWTWRTFDSVAPDAAYTSVPQHGIPVYLDIQNMRWMMAGTGVGSCPAPQSAFYRGYVWTMGTTLLAGPGGTGVRVPYGGKYHAVNCLFRFGPRPGDPILFAPGTAGAEGPRATVALAAYSNRLWVGGGIAPTSVADTYNGGTGSQKDDLTNKILTPNTLYFTNDGVDPILGVASWQTLGVTNNIVVGSETSSDRIVALAAAGRYLLILKRYSTWVLTGSSVDSFNLRQVSATDGLVDPRGVTVVNDVVFYLGPRGLMRYDGAELKMVSQAMNQLLLPALAAWGTPSSPRSAIVSVGQLAENYIIVTVGAAPIDSEPDVSFSTAFSAIYNTIGDRWALFESSMMVAGAPQSTVTASQRYFALDRNRVVEVTNLVTPLSEPAGNRGFDLDEAGAKSIFPVQCRMAPARLSSPRARAQLNRVGAEYYFQQGDGSTDSGRFQIGVIRYALQDNQDKTDTIMSPQVLPSRRPFTDISERPKIAWFDEFGELTDLQVEFTRETTGDKLDTLYRAELLGAAIEVQTPTNKRT